MSAFYYRVEMTVRLSRSRHTRLMEMSAAHYDQRCRNLSQPGDKSFLYGWQFSFDGTGPDEVVEVQTTWQELDLLCKVTEQVETESKLVGLGLLRPGSEARMSVDVELYWWVRQLFREIRDETHRVNGSPT